MRFLLILLLSISVNIFGMDPKKIEFDYLKKGNNISGQQEFDQFKQEVQGLSDLVDKAFLIKNAKQQLNWDKPESREQAGKRFLEQAKAIKTQSDYIQFLEDVKEGYPFDDNKFLINVAKERLEFNTSSSFEKHNQQVMQKLISHIRKNDIVTFKQDIGSLTNFNTMHGIHSLMTYATFMKRKPFITHLLDQGFDINASAQIGTPLKVARVHAGQDMVSFLKQYGAQE